jgi:hypothetical protein
MTLIILSPGPKTCLSRPQRLVNVVTTLGFLPHLQDLDPLKPHLLPVYSSDLSPELHKLAGGVVSLSI